MKKIIVLKTNCATFCLQITRFIFMEYDKGKKAFYLQLSKKPKQKPTQEKTAYSIRKYCFNYYLD